MGEEQSWWLPRAPEPGTAWTSQIAAIAKPILLLQQRFFFFFLSWSVHNGMRSEKVGIPALRNSRKNTVQRQKVLPGSEISEFQMSSLLSFAAFEGAFPSCLRCHKRWILSPCSADFSKRQKMPLKYCNWQHWLHK